MGCQAGHNLVIEDGALIGEDVVFGANCVIEGGAIVGDGCYIDSNTVVRAGTEIGPRSFIGANCVVGEHQLDFCLDRKSHGHKLVIGADALIRSGSILYTGSNIGTRFETGHHVTVREGASIGNHVMFGTLADVQGDCVIGDYVRAHSNVHIGRKMVIDSFVWMFPYTLLTNDPNPPSEDIVGSHINSFAVLASRCVILPGSVIGQDSLVSANSVASGSLKPRSVYAGSPARRVSSIEALNVLAGKDVYPWRDHFRRGMPWEAEGFEIWASSLPEETFLAYGFDRLEL